MKIYFLVICAVATDEPQFLPKFKYSGSIWPHPQQITTSEICKLTRGGPPSEYAANGRTSRDRGHVKFDGRTLFYISLSLFIAQRKLIGQ